MPPLPVAPFTGPLLVTVLYFLLYYALVINVARVKGGLDREYRARDEKFDRYFSQDRRMLAADRMHLNMLEQMGPFVVLLWLHAVFVGPLGATVAGGIYVAARALYPLLMGATLGRGIPNLILVSTAPNYLVIVYFAGSLVLRALVG
jgi:hypothetical protein